MSNEKFIIAEAIDKKAIKDILLREAAPEIYESLKEMTEGFCKLIIKYQGITDPEQFLSVKKARAALSKANPQPITEG